MVQLLVKLLVLSLLRNAEHVSCGRTTRLLNGSGDEDAIPRPGYRYNGLDLLLCPWSYTCGEPGSPVPPDQIIPTTCCSGCIRRLTMVCGNGFAPCSYILYSYTR